MTISTTDFPIWFSAGFYGGLVCCVLTIAISLRTLYTDIRRRGITRRLLVVAVVCSASFICLLPTFVWFRVDFNTQVSLAETTALLCCVVFFGWLLPIGATVSSSVLARSSLHNGQQELPHTGFYPPRYQSGVMAPFVFGAESPWGWLEYRSGNFQGQRLALKRAIITLGRAEDSDIWLDDDMASRRHAEIAWEKNVVYLTDCESLNNTHLNGQRVRGSVLLSSNDIIEIGTHRFLFLLTEQKPTTPDEYDPLVNHKWRSSFELQDSRETTQFRLTLPTTKPLADTGQINMGSQHVKPNMVASKLHTPLPATKPLVDTGQINIESQHVEPDTVASNLHTSASLPTARGMLFIRNGELAGKALLLQGGSLMVGSGPNCDLVVPNLALAPRHTLFIRQTPGDYIQDLSGLSGQGGTLINGEPIQGTQLLQHGDRLSLGSFRLTYLSTLQVSEEQASSLQKVVPANAPLSNGLMPLRLPSRPKGT